MSKEVFRDTLFADIGYTPTAAEAPVHDSDARNKLVAGGERGGKSRTGSIEADLAAIKPTTELIWLVGPDYDGSMEEFYYLADDMLKVKLLRDVSEAHKGSLWMELWNGNRAVTKSAMDFKKLGMQAPGFILVCEAARMEYMAFLRLLGRAIEKKAPIVLTGTFEGASESGLVGSWFAELFTRWQVPNEDGSKSFSLPTWSNLIKFPGGRQDPEILRVERNTLPDIFQERYGAVPCKPAGLIIPEFSNKLHVGYFGYDPAVPVEIAVDPGYGVPGAHVVMAIQVKDGDVYLVDEMYLQRITTEQIITRCQKDWKWFGKVEYGAIDIAAKTHQAMPAPIEVWRAKTPIHLQMKSVSVEGGVEALRTFLKIDEHGRSKMYVNHTCKGFIAECGGGPSPVAGGGPWIRNPNTGEISKENCHSTKAVIYWLVSRFGYTPTNKRKKARMNLY